MRKIILVIFTLLPLIGWGQAEKAYRSIRIDSLKALNGGSIDAKDIVKFEKQISIGGSVDASALMTMISTDKGILIPRMTTAQRDAIGSPATGLLIFNTTTNRFEFFEATWQVVGDGNGDGIYGGDGSLSGATTVTQGANTLSFEGSVVNSFSVDGVTFSVDGNTNRVGFGTATPTHPITFKATNVEDGIAILNSSNIQHALIGTGVLGGKLFLENAAGSSNVLLFNDNSSSFDFLETGKNFGIGLSSSITAQLHVAGVNAAPTSDALLVTDNTGVTPLLIVENGGQVGINTLDPNSILTVKGLITDDAISIENSSGVQHAIIGTSASGGRIRLEDASGTTDIFSVNDILSSYDFFNTGRRLGIGTDNPMNIVDIRAITADDGLIISNSSGVLHSLIGTSGGGGRIRLEDNAGTTDIFAVNDVLSSHDFLNTGRRFGIGTDNPLNIVDIHAITANDGLTISNSSGGNQEVLLATGTNGGRLRLRNTAGNTDLVFINAHDATDDFFNTGNNMGIGTTTPTSKLDVNGDVEIGSSNAYYLGDPTTDGSWRIIRSGDDLLMQQRESGTWNTKQTISGA